MDDPPYIHPAPGKKIMSTYKAIPAYYDPEYGHYDMLRRDVPLMLRHMPRRRQKVLELAVGTARAAITIAKAGHHVTGVDYDPEMIEIAAKKRDAAGLSEMNLTLRQANLLRLNLNEQFDWICLLFNTFLNFTTLKDQDAVLSGVVRHLKPKGRFWLDIFQPNLSLIAEEASIDLDPFVFYVPELDRTVFKVTDVHRDPSAQLQRITFRYGWFDANGRAHTDERQFDLTFMFPRELQLLLERHGLKIEHFYGDYDASPLDADSPRMIVQCKRA